MGNKQTISKTQWRTSTGPKNNASLDVVINAQKAQENQGKGKSSESVPRKKNKNIGGIRGKKKRVKECFSQLKFDPATVIRILSTP